MPDSESKKLTILAAIDLNPGSTLVLEQAIALAATRPRAEIHVVTVVEPELPLGVHPGLVGADQQGPFAQRTADFCRELVERIAKETKAQKIAPIFVHAIVGWAAEEIVWLAAHLDADFVVVATHGRRGVKRLLVGSVAERVVRLAGCPVVVVRDKAHDKEWRIPEIEPLCRECAETRRRSEGRELWCARHQERHVRNHLYHYSASGEEPPHAWSSSTGT